jgi:hypothetical protein
MDESPEPIGHSVVPRAPEGAVTDFSEARRHICSNIGTSHAGRNSFLSRYRRQENSGAPLEFAGEDRKAFTSVHDGSATEFQPSPQLLKKKIPLPDGFFCYAILFSF